MVTKEEKPDKTGEKKVRERKTSSGKRVNMHENIAYWCDCCPCEPEERWIKVAEEMGIDLSDYED